MSTSGVVSSPQPIVSSMGFEECGSGNALAKKNSRNPRWSRSQ